MTQQLNLALPFSVGKHWHGKSLVGWQTVEGKSKESHQGATNTFFKNYLLLAPHLAVLSLLAVLRTVTAEMGRTAPSSFPLASTGLACVREGDREAAPSTGDIKLSTPLKYLKF